MKRFLALMFVGLMLAGPLHAQTTYSVALSWTGPAGCTLAAPCTYIPYRLAGVCPATLSVTTQPWVALPPTAAQVTTASDAAVTYGATYCYFLETQQAGASSGPSATVQVVIPGGVSPPTGLTPTVVTVTIVVN